MHQQVAKAHHTRQRIGQVALQNPLPREDRERLGRGPRDRQRPIGDHVIGQVHAHFDRQMKRALEDSLGAPVIGVCRDVHLPRLGELAEIGIERGDAAQDQLPINHPDTSPPAAAAPGYGSR